MPSAKKTATSTKKPKTTKSTVTKVTTKQVSTNNKSVTSSVPEPTTTVTDTATTVSTTEQDTNVFDGIVAEYNTVRQTIMNALKEQEAVVKRMQKEHARLQKTVDKSKKKKIKAM